MIPAVPCSAKEARETYSDLLALPEDAAAELPWLAEVSRSFAALASPYSPSPRAPKRPGLQPVSNIANASFKANCKRVLNALSGEALSRQLRALAPLEFEDVQLLLDVRAAILQALRALETEACPADGSAPLEFTEDLCEAIIHEPAETLSWNRFSTLFRRAGKQA